MFAAGAIISAEATLDAAINQGRRQVTMQDIVRRNCGSVVMEDVIFLFKNMPAGPVDERAAVRLLNRHHHYPQGLEMPSIPA